MTTLIQPRVFDLNGNDILDPDEVYPGCYARATVNVYSYDNKSKGVAIGLRQVQKIRDGERIDGRSAGSDFDEFADEGWLEEHTDSLLDDPDVDF